MTSAYSIARLGVALWVANSCATQAYAATTATTVVAGGAAATVSGAALAAIAGSAAVYALSYAGVSTTVATGICLAGSAAKVASLPKLFW